MIITKLPKMPNRRFITDSYGYTAVQMRMFALRAIENYLKEKENEKADNSDNAGKFDRLFVNDVQPPVVGDGQRAATPEPQ